MSQSHSNSINLISCIFKIATHLSRRTYNVINQINIKCNRLPQIRSACVYKKKGKTQINMIRIELLKIKMNETLSFGRYQSRDNEFE